MAGRAVPATDIGESKVPRRRNGRPTSTGARSSPSPVPRPADLTARARQESDRSQPPIPNSLPQFATAIGDFAVHSAAVFSGDPDAVPLVLLHGWPGSCYGFCPRSSPSSAAARRRSTTSPCPVCRDTPSRPRPRIAGLSRCVAVGGDIGGLVTSARHVGEAELPRSPPCILPPRRPSPFSPSPLLPSSSPSPLFSLSLSLSLTLTHSLTLSPPRRLTERPLPSDDVSTHELPHGL